MLGKWCGPDVSQQTRGQGCPDAPADPVEFPGSWEIWASSGKRGCGSNNRALMPRFSKPLSFLRASGESPPCPSSRITLTPPTSPPTHSPKPLRQPAGYSLHPVCFLENSAFPPPRQSPRFHLPVIPRKKKNLKRLKIEPIITKGFLCCLILIMNKILMKRFTKRINY